MVDQKTVDLLERIAVALERIVDLGLVAMSDETSVEPEAPAVVVCLHPLDQRVDFGVTGGVPDFHCRACGYRSVPEVEARPV